MRKLTRQAYREAINTKLIPVLQELNALGISVLAATTTINSASLFDADECKESAVIAPPMSSVHRHSVDSLGSFYTYDAIQKDKGTKEMLKELHSEGLVEFLEGYFTNESNAPQISKN